MNESLVKADPVLPNELDSILAAHKQLEHLFCA